MTFSFIIIYRTVFRVSERNAMGICLIWMTDLLYRHPDSAVRVRNDLLRWIMGFSSLTRMGWELTNNGRSPSVL